MSSNEEHSLTIQTLLNEDNYRVPVYQRNYDWEEAQIRQLINDIQDFSLKKNSQTYYLGSLVAHKRADYFEILDGQQRFTTLSLIACYLKYRLPLIFPEYQRPNLCFESRPKSDLAINRLFEVFNSQTSTDNTFSSLIETSYSKEFNSSIFNGFKIIERVISETFKQENKLEDFVNYLLNNVQIFRITVPKNTDVTHYFEVMNNRGEQLEKHEVVKAHLLSIIQESDLDNKDVAMATLQKVWLACADMNSYVQTGFSVAERKAIFGSSAEDFIIDSFDKISIAVLGKDYKNSSDGENNKIEPLSLATSIDKGAIHRTDKQQITDTRDIKQERFDSVIDFPNFLMHVLRIYLDPTSNSIQELPALDDKILLSAFDNFKDPQAIKVKEFIFTLLKTRYLFDRYIIKRDNASNRESWSLKRYKLYDSSSSNYVDSFSGDEDHLNDSTLSCLMLISAFHVSYPTNSRKNWLSAVLYWLSQDEHLNSLTAESYLNFLENLSRDFIVNRYLIAKPNDYPKFMYASSAELSILPYKLSDSDYDFECHLRYDKVAVFVFNYLDYLLWKDSKVAISKKKEFRFSFKNSKEHFSPQTSRINEILPEDKLHSFGNLCLMGSSENSSLSNDTPKQKTEILNSQRNRMAPLSLKLELMMQTAQENWNIKTIDSHRYDMVKILQEDIEQKLKGIA